MAREKTKISVYLGVLQDGGAGVKLPRYQIVYPLREDAEGFIVADVLVDDDELTNGKPDAAKIRAKYKGHPDWDTDELADLLARDVVI